MVGKVKDLTNMKFGRLTVTELIGIQNHRAVWHCICECGKETTATATHLISGNTQSCGCLHRELVSKMGKGNTTHHGCPRLDPKSRRLYQVWSNMKARCTDKNHRAYANYGGRGIVVCEEWLHNFAAFRDWAIRAGYDYDAPYGELTLDRIDNDKGYSPDNCRWVNMQVQASNKRHPQRGVHGRFVKAAPGVDSTRDGGAAQSTTNNTTIIDTEKEEVKP